MIDARVDVKPTLYNLIPTLPGLVHSPVLSQNECTRGRNLQTAFTLFTKVVTRPELTVCLKRCFVSLYVSKLGKRAKPIQFYSDCYEELVYKKSRSKNVQNSFCTPRKDSHSFIYQFLLKTPEDSFTRTSNTFLDKPYLS